MMKYILKRMYYNILGLVIVYIATALTNVPFREWIVITATSSAYMVNHYLERKSR